MTRFRADRSTDYRRRFIESDPGPWRCRYCGKRLGQRDDMTVDHVIPVDAVAHRGPRALFWRRFLERNDVIDVNDLRNLVPACRRCNSRKGPRTGVWVARAWLGKHPAWWPIRRVLQIAAAAACVALAAWLLSGDGLAAVSGHRGLALADILRSLAKSL